MSYEVEVALDADSALEIMEKRPADVAVIDIRMPGHDGVWLIERLQRTHPETAIVIATGIQSVDPRLTLRPGVVGYVVKPFQAEKIQEVVKKAVASARALPPRPRLRLLSRSPSHEGIADVPDGADGEE